MCSPREGFYTVKSGNADHSRGFTLIELLTVVFIIGLLAAILIPTVAKVRERARITRAEANLRSLATALSDYQIDHATLPPIAGCPVRDIGPGDPYPYIARLGLIDQEMRASFDDSFSESEDLNANLVLELVAEDRPQWRIINPVTKEGRWELNGEIDPGPVPYQYFPVNGGNLRKFRQMLNSRGDALANESHSGDDLRAAGLTIPPPFYDRFVVFSLGPDNSDHDIIPRNATNKDDLRLRAYYRVTLDLNGNDVLDFNFRDRAKGLETARLPDFGQPYKKGVSGIIILMGP